jgi:hypothetical protein
MVRPKDKPAKPGEHTVKKGVKPTLGDSAQEVPGDDDESRTERMEPYREALDASEKLFRRVTEDNE